MESCVDADAWMQQQQMKAGRQASSKRLPRTGQDAAKSGRSEVQLDGEAPVLIEGWVKSCCYSVGRPLTVCAGIMSVT